MIKHIGMDLAKEVLEVCGQDERGAVVLRKRLRRREVLAYFGNFSRCTIGMEACGGAHYWAREFIKLGHEVRIISPQFVKPYVKSNKNDRADAEAVCEALGRPGMRFVPTKSVEQQDILALHRVRKRLVREKTKVMNEIRGLLLERGIAIPQGVKALRVRMLGLATGESLSLPMKTLFQGLMEEIGQMEGRIDGYTRQIAAHATVSEVCQRLMTVPGVGVLTASALVAEVSDPHVFKNGRGLAAFLGLVPRQYSSGGTTRLGRISKRGNKYLRELLIHGTRSVIRQAAVRQDRRSRWIESLVARRGMNKACVALANRNARVLWRLMTSDQTYRAAN